MDFSGFIGSLKTPEMEMKVRREKEPTKKKYIALKATPFSIEEEESSEYNGEDFAMLIQKVGRIFYKNGR